MERPRTGYLGIRISPWVRAVNGVPYNGKYYSANIWFEEPGYWLELDVQAGRTFRFGSSSSSSSMEVENTMAFGETITPIEVGERTTDVKFAVDDIINMQQNNDLVKPNIIPLHSLPQIKQLKDGTVNTLDKEAFREILRTALENKEAIEALNVREVAEPNAVPESNTMRLRARSRIQ